MTPSTFSYVMYALCGIMGLAISTVLILRSLSQKSRAASTEFSVAMYFKLDWFTPVGSLLTIVLFLMMVDVTLKWNPSLVNWLKPAFATVGYFGSDISSRLFSVMNGYINKAVDYKTDISDKVNGTLGTRTPIIPPKDSSPKI